MCFSLSSKVLWGGFLYKKTQIKSNQAVEFSTVKRLSFWSKQERCFEERRGKKINIAKWIHVCAQCYLSAVLASFEVLFVRKHSHLMSPGNSPLELAPRLEVVIRAKPRNSKNSLRTNIWAHVSQAGLLLACDFVISDLHVIDIERFQHNHWSCTNTAHSASKRSLNAQHDCGRSRAATAFRLAC